MSHTVKAIAGSLRADIWIACPARHIWKCALEFPKWSPSVKRAELVAGEWDQEGGVVLITKQDGVNLDPFHTTNLKMRPYSQMVFKADSKEGDQMHGFLDISFEEVNGRTRVTYSNYLVYRMVPEPSSDDLQGAKGIESITNSYLKPLRDYSEKTWK